VTTTQRIEPKPRGTYVHRDTRYVSEWVSATFPHDLAAFNVRLGPAPLELRLRYPDLDIERWARVWAKTADAIVITPNALLLIEGELRRPVVAIGELLVYRDLVPQTFSLARYWSLPVKTILLTPLGDPTLETVLQHLGIETVPYRPFWVDDYLRSVGRLS